MKRAMIHTLLVGSFLYGAGLATVQAEELQLPAGTVIPVRFETTVASNVSRPEDRVLAVVREDVRHDGVVVIPSGSEVRGYVVSARRSGRVKGRANLSVAFNEVVVRGRHHRLATRRVFVQAPATHGRDAAMIGGGAGAGALIGGLTHGGSGAAKGAVIGAGAGTGAVLVTRGKEVTLPAGTRWRLRLVQPVEIG